MRRSFELQAPDCQQQQHNLEPQPCLKSNSRSTNQFSRGVLGQTHATGAVETAFDVLRRPERARAGVRIMQPPTTTFALSEMSQAVEMGFLQHNGSAGRQYSSAALHVTLPHLEKSALPTAPTLQHGPGTARLKNLSPIPGKHHHLNVQLSHCSLPTLSSFGLRYDLTDSSAHGAEQLSHSKRRSMSPLPMTSQTHKTTSQHQTHCPSPDLLTVEPSLNSLHSALCGKHVGPNRVPNKPAHLPDLPESTMRVAHGFSSSSWPTASSPLPQPPSQAHARPHGPCLVPDSPLLAHTSPLQIQTAGTQPAIHANSSSHTRANSTTTGPLSINSTPSRSVSTSTATPLTPPRQQQQELLPDVKLSSLEQSDTCRPESMTPTVSFDTTTPLQTTAATDPEDSGKKAGRWSDQPSRFFGHLQHANSHIGTHQPAKRDAHCEPDATPLQSLASLLSTTTEHLGSSPMLPSGNTPSPSSTKSTWQETVDRLSMPSNVQHHPDPNSQSVPSPWPQTLARSLTFDEHRRRPPHMTLNQSAAPEPHSTWPSYPSAAASHSLDGSPAALRKEPSHISSPQLSPSVSYSGSYVQDEDAPRSTFTSRQRRVTLVLPEGGCSNEGQSDSDEGGSGDESSPRAGASAGKHKSFVSNMSRFKQVRILSRLRDRRCLMVRRFG